APLQPPGGRNPRAAGVGVLAPRLPHPARRLLHGTLDTSRRLVPRLPAPPVRSAARALARRARARVGADRREPRVPPRGERALHVPLSLGLPEASGSVFEPGSGGLPRAWPARH